MKATNDGFMIMILFPFTSCKSQQNEGFRVLVRPSYNNNNNNNNNNNGLITASSYTFFFFGGGEQFIGNIVN